jgi:hypothetical protein
VKHKLWLVFAVILALGVTAHFMIRSAEDKVTAEMLSRAARFAIPADWKLTDEIVRPERFMCISTNPCPSLSRRWETGKELTDNDVAAVVSGGRCRDDCRRAVQATVQRHREQHHLHLHGKGRRIQLLALCRQPRPGGTSESRPKHQGPHCAGLATPVPRPGPSGLRPRCVRQ